MFPTVNDVLGRSVTDSRRQPSIATPPVLLPSHSGAQAAHHWLINQCMQRCAPCNDFVGGFGGVVIVGSTPLSDGVQPSGTDDDRNWLIRLTNDG